MEAEIVNCQIVSNYAIFGDMEMGALDFEITFSWIPI